MVDFLAQSVVPGVPSVEQAAKSLADQTWNQPAIWWVSLFLFLTIFALVFVLWRGMKKDDAKDVTIDRLQEQRVQLASEVQETADDYATLSQQIVNSLQNLDRKLDRCLEILVEIGVRLSGRGGRGGGSNS